MNHYLPLLLLFTLSAHGHSEIKPFECDKLTGIGARNALQLVEDGDTHWKMKLHFNVLTPQYRKHIQSKLHGEILTGSKLKEIRVTFEKRACDSEGLKPYLLACSIGDGSKGKLDFEFYSGKVVRFDVGDPQPHPNMELFFAAHTQYSPIAEQPKSGYMLNFRAALSNTEHERFEFEIESDPVGYQCRNPRD